MMEYVSPHNFIVAAISNERTKGTKSSSQVFLVPCGWRSRLNMCSFVHSNIHSMTTSDVKMVESIEARDIALAATTNE